MKSLRLAVLILILTISAACSAEGTHEETGAGASQKTCGDSICDGPENSENCPEDCPESLVPSGEEEKPASSKPEEMAEDGYRYVSFSGTVQSLADFSTAGDFAGDYFEYSGAYSIEIWFPMEGGEAVQQRNSIQLTEFKPLVRGEVECRPCEWTPEEAAYQPLRFELETTLNLEAVTEDGKPADELVYQLTNIPQKSFSVMVDCPCPGVPAAHDDPAAYPQLLTWFYQKLVNPIQLNVLESNPVDSYPISPLGYIAIPEETLSYLIVPDLNTP